MATPRSFALLKLVENSHSAGCSIGKSPGLVPLRMHARAVYEAASELIAESALSLRVNFHYHRR
jgi:hypothetical protein